MTLRSSIPDSNIVHVAQKEKISQEFLKQLRAYSDEEWGDVREQISESMKQAARVSSIISGSLANNR